MDSFFLFNRWYLQNLFQNESDLDQLPLKITGATPFNLFEGIVLVVVVVFTDMVMSSGLGGRAGAVSDEAVGPNVVAAVADDYRLRQAS
jgi:hypothetical protein